MPIIKTKKDLFKILYGAFIFGVACYSIILTCWVLLSWSCYGYQWASMGVYSYYIYTSILLTTYKEWLMKTFMKITGVFALFHSVTSLILLTYYGVTIDLFMLAVFALEFAIGIMMFVGIRVLNDSEYHRTYTFKKRK